MKPFKGVSIASNIALSVLYFFVSWIPGVLGTFGVFMVISELNGGSLEAILLITLLSLLAATPLFCIAGIALSVVFRRREKLAASFTVQFLPFFTLGLAFFLFIILWIFV
jgi:hypothetical protein